MRAPIRSKLAAFHANTAVAIPVIAIAMLSLGVSSAWASVGWTVHDAPEPSSFSASDGACVGSCDRYQLLFQNNGDQAASSGVTFTDKLPAGIVATDTFSGYHVDQVDWECSIAVGGVSVTCSYPDPVPAGDYTPRLTIYVDAPSTAMEKEYAETKVPLRNTVTVEGGGAPKSSAVQQMGLDQTAAFELDEYNFEPQLPGGSPAAVAGGHPWQLTTTFSLPSQKTPAGAEQLAFEPARDFRSVAVELPAGLIGDPLGTARCTESQLREGSCPLDSAVGVFALQSGSNAGSYFESTGETRSQQGIFGCCSDIYNMVPEAGYPAEFGFDYGETIPIVFYANLVHTGTGYRVRVTVPSIGVTKALIGTSVTFFGEPGHFNGTGSKAAFLSSPSDCSAEAEGVGGGVPSGEHGTAKLGASRIELEPWSLPGDLISAESSAYSHLTGCAALEFAPRFSFAPGAAGEEGTTQADSPSGYTASLEVPQRSGFAEASTPDVRNTVVTLPGGTAISPSAADGLVACQATGPEGINIGSSDIGPKGQDKGDPEATELGEGHAGPGGNSSSYDDGVYHTAGGHCPSASKVASVEVTTPLLEEVLSGSVFVAQPGCSPCSEAQVEKGEVFGLYMEVTGVKAGVDVKLPGKVEVGGEGREGGKHNNLAPGQVRTSFPETPQLPFRDLKLHFHGGPRATLANSQSCGSFTTTSEIESWAHKEADGTAGMPNATPFSSFAITGCESKFAPSFTAGTTSSQAGAYAPLTATFGRHDGEQDLSGVTVNMPPGLIGKIAGIVQCGEAEANAGTCPASSKVGTATAAAGSGSQPYYQSGSVYLTGPYNGGPFGLSVVVPAKAGPYNLGNVVTRASIRINPATAAVTVVSDPLPQSVDGIPLRLQAVNVTVGETGSFTLNPTSCAQQAVAATLTGAQGASVGASSALAVEGCKTLKFAPELTASTQGNGTRKGDGASLDVKIAYPQGGGYANIAKVDTSLPLALSSRLTTLNKACTETQFAVDPAGCPPASAIGIATARTPLLSSPMSGPAYLVSHGGRAFPDLDIVLQGEGVEIVLTGNTDIKKGITYSKFETVPDAPVSSFELNLPEKENSILAAVKNLCAPTKTVTTSRKVTRRVKGKLKKVTVRTTKAVAEPLIMPTEITAQNGAVIKQDTKVAVTGCAKSKPARKAAGKRKSRKSNRGAHR
jgi:uncharacterized repeat protein (TIGR01451 family)